jgi:hypothetical protein
MYFALTHIGVIYNKIYLVVFVDFRKVYDTINMINHTALFYELCKIGIVQYFYSVIKSIYQNTAFL